MFEKIFSKKRKKTRHGKKQKTSKKKPTSQYTPFTIKEPRHLKVIPNFKKMSDIDFKYTLLEPFVFARIKWDPKEKRIFYTILEPELTKEESELITKLESDLSEIIDVKISALKGDKAVEYIEKKLKDVLEDNGMTLDAGKYKKVMYYIIRDFIGLNEIEPLMHDPYIEDIGCSGMETPIYIVHKRFGSLQTNLRYTDFDKLSNFVVKMSERCGRYISYASPLLDGSLPDGSRVQASLAKDVTTKGPTFSIRKFRRNPFSPTDMLNMKTMSADILAYLWLLIQYNVSVLVCGGVSTGKTTTLNALTMFIPPEDKIISIEDTREINIPHENWIPSVARTGFGIPEAGGKRYGEVDLFDLLKESFRQNPDYVIVGEVRGKEAYVMFQGMASGHPCIGTIHAGSLGDVVKRLQSPPIELSPSLIESLDVIIVLINVKEQEKSMRRVKEIVEVQSIEPNTGRAHTLEIFGWIPSQDIFKENITNSDVMRRISFQEGLSYPKLMEDFEKRKRFLLWMQRHNVVQFDEVSRLVNLYYKDNSTVMKWVEKDIKPYATMSEKEVRKAWKKAKKEKKRGRKGLKKMKKEPKKEVPAKK
jgi:flagellar protein FlaI